MVLQYIKKDAPADVEFGHDQAPNENDGYASMSPSGARFDPTVLPQPLPVIGACFGLSDRTVRYTTETTIKLGERMIGRQLNGQESQALAFHIYQLEQTKTYFAGASAAAGAYRAYATMARNTYPFYQPKPEKVNPNKFAFIKGPWAPFARHALRFSLYFYLWGQMGSVIGHILAQPTAAMNTSRDPKLEQFGNELKAVQQTRAREVQDRKREFERQTRDPSGMGPSPQPRWGKQPRAPPQGEEDDMSPTASNEPWDAQPSSAGSWDSFSSQQQNTPQQQHAPPSNDAYTRRPRPASSSSPFDDDDASPTGGMFRDDVSQNQQQSQPGESSWERLRRGGAPVPVQRPVPRRTFVEGDEERSRERERAQQEFDARMERERQGKDFSEDGGRKW